jgi:MazG family protein
MTDSAATKFSNFVKIIERLRRECPWDRRQTAESLRSYILEECYEVLESIDQGNWDQLKGELGDLLLQIVLQGAIASELDRFTIAEVLDTITAKMIERHPHVFANLPVNGVEDVRRNWEQIKLDRENRDSLLAGLPATLPALLRAQRLQEKAAAVNFDWPDISGVLSKVEEEIQELKQAIQNQDAVNMREEVGDLFFSLVNVSRFLELSAEDTLRAANEKFSKRFHFLEERFGRNFERMKKATADELDRIWNESKEC